MIRPGRGLDDTGRWLRSAPASNRPKLVMLFYNCGMSYLFCLPLTICSRFPCLIWSLSLCRCLQILGRSLPGLCNVWYFSLGWSKSG